MASSSINKFIERIQRRNLLGVIIGCVLVTGVSILLVSHDKPKNQKQDADLNNLTGVVDASFNEANVESALTTQQVELESLKKQMTQLREAMEKADAAHEKEVINLTAMVGDAVKPVNTTATDTPNSPSLPVFAS